MAPTDEELMLRVQAGDSQSFGDLALRYHRPLFRLALAQLGRREDAEEIRQEALLRAFSQAARFRPEGRFRSWIYRIAVNLCRDRNRRRRRLQWFSLEHPADAGATSAPEPTADIVAPEVTLGQQEVADRVRAALGRISEEQRTVLVLKEFEGLRFREIAEVLGCPESTVKSRLYRGLLALRKALGAPTDLRGAGESGSGGMGLGRGREEDRHDPERL